MTRTPTHEELEQKIRALEEAAAGGKRTEGALRQSEERFRAIFEHSTNGKSLTGPDGKLLRINKAFADMLGYTIEEAQQLNFIQITHPEDMAKSQECVRILLAGEQTKHRFEKRYIHKSGDAVWADVSVMLLRDERGTPIHFIANIVDITERKRADLEQAIIAELGRIIGSSLDINEVYEQFVDEARKLIPFDWLRVSLTDLQSGAIRLAYTNGMARKSGDTIPLRVGSITEELMRTRTGFILDLTTLEGDARRYHVAVPAYKAGIRSMLTVPLISRSDVIGSLGFRSKKPNAYIHRDLALAQRIGDQIVGAIANAELYAKLKREEQEKAVMAEIGRIIGSSLNIDEVYELFTIEAKKLIGFNWLSVALINLRDGLVRIAHTSETDLSLRRPQGDTFPLAGSLNERVMRTGTGFIVEMESIEEIAEHYPHFVESYKEGLRSAMNVPLFSQGNVIGSLNFRSRRPHAYTPADLRLAERIGEQIAGAISNEALYRELSETEKALRESEALYRLLADNMTDAVWLTDSDLKPTYCSPSVEKMRGYTSEEIKQMPLEKHLTPPSLRLALEAFSAESSKVLADPTYPARGTLELEFYRKDGTTLWTESSFSLIRDRSGRPESILFESRDITDRKRAEEEKRRLEERLQRAEKMESLGLLAGGVAHDLNNTLGILVGYSELVYEGLDEADPLRKDVQNIMMGGERAAAIVQDLLTLARRGVQMKTVVNINRTVADFLESPEYLKLTSLHPAVRIRTELEEGILKMTGSQVHVSKTLINLVSNAAEAMPAGGDVVIGTESRYLDRPVSGYDKVAAGEYVVLTVSDQGDGIADDDLKRIFEPFYTKKVMGRSGTGLGLSVVWGTVKDHNGYIDVRTIKGKGTIFTLYFPATREEMEEDRVTLVEEYMGKGETILVVDDLKDQRDLAGRILSELNYRVETVASGEDAVNHLKVKSADLIVLDMIMEPGIDGFETYRRIIENRPGQKAILVTGFSETERVSMAQSLGAGGCVKKPYMRGRIGMAVRRELDKK